MKKIKLLAVSVALLLALSFVFITCDMGSPDPQSANTFHPRAATPIITAQPNGLTYFKNETSPAPATLSVTAVAAPGCTISAYQWYYYGPDEDDPESTEPIAIAISNATNPTYTASVDVSKIGETTYFVAVTSNDPTMEDGYKNTVLDSSPAVISVVEDGTVGITANATVTVSSAKKQYVRGFGGMLVSWANFPNTTLADMENMFNPNKLGYNMMRVMVLPYNTDIRVTMDEFTRLETFPDKDEGQYFYEFVKIVNGYNGYVLASPWSPPAEWKTNDVIDGGGNLKPNHEQLYGQYLKEFCKLMGEKGAPIYAISIQNEPNYEATYDGCEWSESAVKDFFVKVGRFTQGVKGYGGGKEIAYVKQMNGESANTVHYNDTALNNTTARGYIDLIGRHQYGSVEGPYPLAKSFNKEVWQTEHNINSGEGSYDRDSTWNFVWLFMNDIDRSIRVCEENAYIWWAMKRFYSMIGDGQYGTVDGVLLPRGHGMSHYAKFAKEMWQVGVTVSGTLADNSTAITTAICNSAVDYTTASSRVRISGYLSEDGNTVSLVMYTPRGGTDSTTAGYDMGTVKIALPDGFVAKGATAMRSKSSAMSVWEDVKLSADRTWAIVSLPPEEILSVRFTK